MASKSRRSLSSTWITCDKCQSILSQKDVGVHDSQCPPSNEVWTHSYIKNCVLYSTVEVYSSRELPKNITEKDIHEMVFMSRSALELCEIPIGDRALVSFDNMNLVKTAWPTNEKSLTSIDPYLLTALFWLQSLQILSRQTLHIISVTNILNMNVTDHAIDLNEIKGPVKVKRFTEQVLPAIEIMIEYIYTGKQPQPKITTELRDTLKKHSERKIFCLQNKLSIPFNGKKIIFKVVDIAANFENTTEETTDKNLSAMDLIEKLKKMEITLENTPDFFEATMSTKWTITNDDAELKVTKDKLGITMQDIGGYHDLLNDLRDVFDIVLGKCKKILKGFKFSKGILIYGTTGVGKTSIANALISEYSVNIFVINASDVYSKFFGEGDKKLSDLFNEAKSLSPSVILIEDIDVLSPKKSPSESEKRLMSTVIQEIDKLQEADVNTLLIATSSKPDLIDSSLRRAGRIDREFEICAPTPSMRREILQKLLAKLPNAITNEEIDEIAFVTHGFVAADLQCLCSQAAMRAIKRHETHDTTDSTDVFICGVDFNAALTTAKPSAMKEVLVEVPNVNWSDIGGQQSLKLKLQQAVEWPLKHPDAFTRLGITPPRGVLMFGPPGCSKTMVARALATESKLNFINIKGPELFSKWVGESEKAVREVFRKARQVAPSIVFIDEIDALGGERSSGSASNASNNVQERVLAQLLTELDGVTALGNVTLVAATNRPDRIDKALLRPGRLDRIIYVPLPDSQTRTEIFGIKFRKMPVADDVNIQDLVELTEGYSGAEIQAICHEAAMNALEESLEADIITKRNFKAALSIVSPRTPASLVKMYEDYENNR